MYSIGYPGSGLNPTSPGVEKWIFEAEIESERGFFHTLRNVTKGETRKSEPQSEPGVHFILVPSGCSISCFIMRVNFYLKDRSKIETVVRMFIRYDKELLIYPTGERIRTKDWNENTQQARKNSFPGYSEFNSRLNKLGDTVQTVFREYQNDNDHRVPTPVVLRQLLDRATNKDTSHIKDSVLLSWKTYKDKSGKEVYQYSGYFEEFFQNTQVRHNEKTGDRYNLSYRIRNTRTGRT